MNLTRRVVVWRRIRRGEPIARPLFQLIAYNATGFSDTNPSQNEGVNSVRLILFISPAISCIVSLPLSAFAKRVRIKHTQSLPDSVHRCLAVYHDSSSIERTSPTAKYFAYRP